MFAIIDIETCGSKYEFKRGRITEICIAVHDGLQVIEKWSTLINPECNISPYFVSLSGITNEMVANAPKFHEVAKKIIELAMSKMPMDYYGYYTMVEPFAKGYYNLGEKEKAREILERLATKYKQNLTYYSGIQPSIQTGIASDIITDIERYRSLLYVMRDNGDVEFYNKNKINLS